MSRLRNKINLEGQTFRSQEKIAIEAKCYERKKERKKVRTEEPLS